MSLTPLCAKEAGTLRWQVDNRNSFAINFTWWVPGGQSAGERIAVLAASAVIFETPVEGTLPNEIGILWFDSGSGGYNMLTANNDGVSCGDELALIPITGSDQATPLQRTLLENVGLGLFGFTLILMGIGIMLDRQAEDE